MTIRFVNQKVEKLTATDATSYQYTDILSDDKCDGEL